MGALAVIFIALYSAMFISGHTTPKLGLDLQGGTSVTLTPKVASGNPNAKVPSSSVDQAVDIIRQRVDGLGVAEADVVRAKNNIEISVPGKGRTEVVKLVGQTAQLTFRIPAAEVQAPVANPTASPTPTPSASTSPTPSTSATPTPTPKASATPTASSASPSASSSSLTGQAAVPAVPVASTSAAVSTPSASASALVPLPSSQATATLPPTTSTTHCLTAKGTGTTPPACITAQLAYPCPKPGTAEGQTVADAPATDWVVACDTTNSVEYALQPASLKGTAVSGASATIQTGVNGTSTGQWIVNVDFNSKGQNQWADLTDTISKSTGCPKSSAPAATPPVTCQLAIELDGVVQSAPVIQERIAGSAEITGSFTESSASNLANVLRYGALPLTFTESQVSDISATLGKESLNAGLLAGAIGLGLVILYSFFYYRAMGIVTIASLAVSAVLTYACVVELGQIINFTLTLAGIAGFIVAVGITADSFVVFYERLKDEVHEGRTVRTSVERSWVRARRTILSADTVSFLAAAALYYLSIGSVKGFAFTLGLSTILDLVVVFLFTKPVVTLLVRRSLFSTSRYSGLSTKALGTTTVATSGPAPRAKLAKRASTAEEESAVSSGEKAADREGS
ncbi:MAG TPA: protein translocase subunit SecD [Frankiaceae bacterium]|jgi:preprotein translocase subunit SecD|nr:protein translocase subunit SecD [Frankiaceae bacterium]